ncbi:hypothetical protein [Nocardia spumae]|uniref:hypothetical protein n=1 Tax=Nocardia spumae TaxID=2887190 RepID=UPI001D140FAA|nr:hypothetical protein [Nocardia spumae]
MIKHADFAEEWFQQQSFGNATTEVYMLTNILNWLLAAWGGVSAGSSGYQIPPGTLPFGS